MKKVVLAYSGGLDTFVCIKWLQDKYDMEVIALTVDVGEGKDLAFIKEKATKIGASKCYVIDAKKEFVVNYAWPTLKANGMYEGIYPLSAALSRPLICKYLIDVAKKEGAVAVAHGCTGKGNDQVRFDVSCSALAPDVKVIAPVREWPMSREDEIEYAAEHGIPIPVGKKNPYSIDQNVWGRSIEAGVLENPWNEPPEDIYLWSGSPANAPDEPEYVEITFEQGLPVAVDGKAMEPLALLDHLNAMAGKHGVGRIDHIENRLVGIKSHEMYEFPGATLLLTAHKAIEQLTLTRETAHFKPIVAQMWAELAYFGLWYSPLKTQLDAFIDATQENVSGTARLKLYKGNAMIVGRKSDMSLYNFNLATYDKGDMFDHQASKGFIDLWGLPTKVAAMVNKEAALKAKKAGN